MAHDNNKWWYVDGPAISITPELQHWVTLTREDGIPNPRVVVPFRLDPITGEEVPIPVNEVEKEYLNKWNFDFPYIFDIIRSITPVVARSFLVYAKKQSYVRKHIHPPKHDNAGYFVRNRRTVTVGIPFKPVSPETDLLLFHYADIDYTGINFKSQDLVEFKELHKKIMQGATEATDIIELPKQGQYLILDFDSSNTTLWEQHNSDNEYIFVVCDV